MTWARSAFTRFGFLTIFRYCNQNSYCNIFFLHLIAHKHFLKKNVQKARLYPNESEVEIIRIDSDWEFSLNRSDLGFSRIKKFFRIDSEWKSRIKSD